MSNLFQKLHLPLEQQCHISNPSLCDCLCYWDSRHALHLGHAFRRDPFQVLCLCSCHHHIFKCSKTAVKSGFPLGGKERQWFALRLCTWQKEDEEQPAPEPSLQKSFVLHWCSFLEWGWAWVSVILEGWREQDSRAGNKTHLCARKMFEFQSVHVNKPLEKCVLLLLISSKFQNSLWRTMDSSAKLLK